MDCYLHYTPYAYRRTPGCDVAVGHSRTPDARGIPAGLFLPVSSPVSRRNDTFFFVFPRFRILADSDRVSQGRSKGWWDRIGDLFMGPQAHGGAPGFSCRSPMPPTCHSAVGDLQISAGY